MYRRIRPNLWLVFVVVATFVLICLSCSNGDDEEQTGEPGNGVGEPASATPPPLLHDYQFGELYSVFGTAELFFIALEALGQNNEKEPADTHVHDDDLVMILGPPFLVDEEWYWLIKVVQGGIYTEGTEYWISDEVSLYGPTLLRDRPVPDVVVGEVLKTSYNFCIHTSPAGPTTHNISGCELLMGDTVVTLLEEPVLADGRYWCYVESEYGEIAWISCEFAKIP